MFAASRDRSPAVGVAGCRPSPAATRALTGANVGDPAATRAASSPPSTGTSMPLIHDADAESRKRTAAAGYAADPCLPTTAAERAMLSDPIEASKSARMGVSIGPGLTDTTRIPRGCNAADSITVQSTSTRFEVS